MHATRLAHLTLDLITVIVAGDLCITRMHWFKWKNLSKLAEEFVKISRRRNSFHF
jgi:hypothetical protein